MVGVKNTSVVNDGLIAGGWSYDATLQANAIEFTKGGNDLEIWSNSDIQGNVTVDRTTNDIDSLDIDTFALGGDTDATFDVTKFGTQFEVASVGNPDRGFTNFEKRGESLWTLENTTNELTPWLLLDGTLSVSEEGNLGDIAGGVSFDGGTLQVTGTDYTTTPRDLTIYENGGGIDIADPDNVFTLNQGIVGGAIGADLGLWKLGAGTLVLNGGNSYNGLTEVVEGKLILGGNSSIGTDASVLGNVLVDPGAILEGHGLIGGDLGNEGIVAPGTLGDIGTLTVNGDYFAQGEGGKLEFTLDGQNGPGVQADELLVVGNAYLDGTTIEVKKEDFFELDCGDNKQLIVAGSYSGSVEALINNDFDKMMLLDKYNTTLYGVNILKDERFEDLAGLNGNQQAIASVLSDEVLDGSNLLDSVDPMHQAVIGMIEECGAAPGVLDALSPETYAGITDYGIHVTRNYTRAAMEMPGAAPFTPEPIAPVSDKGGSKSGSKGGMTESAPVASSKRTTVFGGYTHFDWGTDSSASSDYDIRSNGGIVGARHAFSDVFTAGGFFGIDQGDISSRFVDADVDGWVLGGFVSYLANAEHNIIFDAGVTYGSYDFDGKRNGFGGVSTFDTQSDVIDYFITVKGDAYKNDKFRLTPSLGIHYIDSDVDSFTEKGGLLPLSVRGMSEDALLAELELRAEYAVTSNFLINGTVGYTHNFSDADRSVSSSFIAGGSPFTVNAPGLGEDFFTLGVGAVWYINEAFTLGAGYRAQFGSDSEMSNSFGAGLSYSF